MTVKTNAQGKDRKRLVLTIAKWTGDQVKYAGAPSFAYEVGGITIDKEAGIDFGNALPDEAIDRLLQHLYDEGFEPDMSIEEAAEDGGDEFSGICISMPRSLFTDKNLENLKAITAAKESLIKKALGADSLPIEVTDTKVSFPWFPGEPTPEEIKAAKEKLMASAQALFAKVYEAAQGAQGGPQAGPDMGSAPHDDNVVDGDFKEV